MTSRFQSFEPIAISAEWFRIEAHFNYDTVFFDFSEWVACPDTHRRAAVVAIHEKQHIAPVEDALERLADLVVGRRAPIVIDAILGTADRITDKGERKFLRDTAAGATEVDVVMR